MKKAIKIFVTLIILAAVGCGAWYGWKKYKSSQAPDIVFQTEDVKRSNIMSVINASGTVEPEELVNVGAQVSGKIMSFGKDADGKQVDYGSRVTKGMVLANIDKVLYEAALKEAEATLLQAKAGILRSEANFKQAKAKLALAKRNWERAQELYPKRAMAKMEYDSCESNFLTSTADIAVAEAEKAQAKAQLAIAEAMMVKAERNLSYCVIVSPVDGVIVDRRVSIGQTLVSNMSASSIFLIATDLKKMQVWASVNEADIGSIKKGMPVVFTVDTFPGREFAGVVHKVRLNATMSQNVVTYVVEISTDNNDGTLLPYLTANVRFIRNRRDNVLNVSNAALRYMPDSPALVVPSQRKEFIDGIEREKGERIVWVKEGNLAKFIRVKAGLATGNATELLDSPLKEGDLVINAQTDAKASMKRASLKSDGSSPFMPKMPKRTRNSAKGK